MMKASDLRRQFRAKSVDERIAENGNGGIYVGEGVQDSLFYGNVFDGIANPIVNRGKRNKFINNIIYR